MMRGDATERGGRHLDAEEVAAYLSGDTTGDQRARLERHLARCDRCCDELVAVGALVPAPSRRRQLWLGGGLAAAVLAGILAIGAGAFDKDDAPRFRAADPAEQLLQVEVQPVYPRNDALIAREQLRFVWRSVAPDARYTLMLMEARRGVLWTETSQDTVLTPPREVVLRAGERYLWMVDALLTNGEEARGTGVQRFTVR